jgi:hypothetical protein
MSQTEDRPISPRNAQPLGHEGVCRRLSCASAASSIFAFYYYYPRTPAGIVALHGG